MIILYQYHISCSQSGLSFTMLLSKLSLSTVISVRASYRTAIFGRCDLDTCTTRVGNSAWLRSVLTALACQPPTSHQSSLLVINNLKHLTVL